MYQYAVHNDLYARVVVDEMGWKTEDFHPNLQPVRFESFCHTMMERQNLVEKKQQEKGTGQLYLSFNPITLSRVYTKLVILKSSVKPGLG